MIRCRVKPCAVLAVAVAGGILSRGSQIVWLNWASHLIRPQFNQQTIKEILNMWTPERISQGIGAEEAIALVTWLVEEQPPEADGAAALRAWADVGETPIDTGKTYVGYRVNGLEERVDGLPDVR